MARVVVAAISAVAVILSGCGGSDDDPTSSSTTSSSPSSGPSTGPSAGPWDPDTTSTDITTVQPETTTTQAEGCGKLYDQCGGNSWSGETCCQDDLTCVETDEYYSSCQDISSTTGEPETTTTASGSTSEDPATSTEDPASTTEDPATTTTDQSSSTTGPSSSTDAPASTVWTCTVCQHVYDPASDGEGKAFEELDDDWKCPVCGQPKSAYQPSDAMLKVDATQWTCSVCAHVYDAATDGGGVAFADLPDTWLCPVCGQPKSAYHPQGYTELQV